MPERIQLRRTKGWRKPAGAVVVARPGKWGNPHVVGGVTNSALAVAAFRTDLERASAGELSSPHAARMVADLHELRGRDLACWCKPDAPCHADVLLDLANREPSDA